jgi:predicted  nucleic acid-binding Zn-ribbon protein
MIDEAEAAQARELLAALRDHVAEISQKLETAERRDRRTSVRGAIRDRRHQKALRQELYEAHRLIDGLHRRFPETLHISHGEHRPRVLSAGRPR